MVSYDLHKHPSGKYRIQRVQAGVKTFVGKYFDTEEEACRYALETVNSVKRKQQLNKSRFDKKLNDIVYAG